MQRRTTPRTSMDPESWRGSTTTTGVPRWTKRLCRREIPPEERLRDASLRSLIDPPGCVSRTETLSRRKGMRT